MLQSFQGVCTAGRPDTCPRTTEAEVTDTAFALYVFVSQVCNTALRRLSIAAGVDTDFRGNTDFPNRISVAFPSIV